MKKKICKIAFIDLDGTLIKPFSPNFTEEAVQGVELLKKNNIIPIIITGRHQESAKKIANKLNINYYIANNGSFICDQKNNKIIHENIFRFSDIISFIDKLIEKKFNFFIFSKSKKNTVYNYSSGIVKLILNFQKLYNMKNFNYSQLKSKNPWIYKLVVIGKNNFESIFNNNSEHLAFINKFQKVRTIDKKIITGMNNGWIITRNLVNKLIAAEIILSELSISINEAAAFGDSWNDLVLLKKVGFPIVMKEAPQELHNIALFIPQEKFRTQFLCGVKFLINHINK